jgi:hypothetical protein
MARLALLVLLLTVPAQAGFDLSASATVGSSDVFVHAAASYFDREPSQLERYGKRFGSADDLTVALQLSKSSGGSLADLAAMRERGMGWWDISLRIGADPAVWFVPVTRDPGPPYGKAWGHWKKHGKSTAGWRMSDDECRDWVAVRFLHESLGVDVNAAMEARRNGGSVDALTVRESNRASASGNAKSGSGAQGKSANHGKSGKKGGS